MNLRLGTYANPIIIDNHMHNYKICEPALISLHDLVPKRGATVMNQNPHWISYHLPSLEVDHDALNDPVYIYVEPSRPQYLLH